MPDSAAHRALAARNQGLIDKLLADLPSHPDWLAVVAFYKALHVVESVIFHSHRQRHSVNHENRHGILKDRKYAHIYKYYRPLYAASLIARYLESDHDGTFGTFAAYMSADRVRDHLINHCLRQVERSAQQFIPPPSG